MVIYQKSCCMVCKTTDNVRRCQSCKVAFYCGQEHQMIDRALHKEPCVSIKKSLKNIARMEFEIQEESLSIQIEGIESVNNIVSREIIFLNDDALIKEYLKIHTYEAVEKAMIHCISTLRTYRIDHLDLKYMAPVLLLRLGRDQESYDFVKWYAVTGNDDHYEWEDANQPYLDVTNADYLEAVECFIGNPWHICHAIVVFLIKLRLLKNIQNLHNSMFLYDRLPIEIADGLRNLLVSPMVARNKRIMCDDNLKNLIKMLESQMKQLYADVKAANKYFWPGLLKPETYLAAPLSPKELYIDRTYPDMEERARLAVKMFYDIFDETPGAIQKIEELEGLDERRHE